jgi:hypothetical protein
MITIYTSGADADKSVPLGVAGFDWENSASSNSRSQITGIGALALTADCFMIALGTILAVRTGLVGSDVLSLTVVLPLQMIGACGFLMMCGVYRPPFPGMGTNLILSACAAGLTALIALTPALLSALNWRAFGWIEFRHGRSSRRPHLGAPSHRASHA